MQRIMDLIEQERRQVERGEFFRWLDAPSQNDAQKLAFIPAMYFYVLSFRDLLNLLTGEEDGALQTAVNAYVEEDAGHFVWYLDDLAHSGFGAIEPIALWDRRLLPSRRAIYRMISHAMNYEEPIMRAIIVAIFEATGEIFFRHTKALVDRLGLDDELSYFGKKHYEDEVSHSVKMDELAELSLTEGQFVVAREMVRTAFMEYDGLFDSWMESAKAYGSEIELYDGCSPVAPTLARAGAA